MPADLTAYNAAVKENWTSNDLEEQLYQGAPTLERIEKTTRHQVGGVAKTPIHVSRNGGFTALAGNETVLNAAGAQGLAQATWAYTHQHMQIKLSGSVIDGTANDTLSVVSAVDTEIEFAVADLKHQLERQLFSPFGDGRIAGFGSNASSVTQTLDAAGVYAIAKGFLFVGALVDVGTVGSPASLGSLTVTAIPAANQITLSGSISTTAGTHFISWKGTRTGAVNREMNSLSTIVASSGVLGGVDPATYPQWKAANVDSTTTSLALANIYSMNTAVMTATGAQPDLLVMSPVQFQNIYQQIQPQVRYAGEGNLGTGNMDAVKFAGFEIIRDANAPDTTVFALSSKRLFLVATDKPHWQNDVSGGKILDWIPGEDAFGGRVTYRLQLGTSARNAHASMTALT